MSESSSPRRATQLDQRRVFWLFIFSFSLVLVYGGCAKPANVHSLKVKAAQTEVGYTTFRTPLNKPAAQISPAS